MTPGIGDLPQAGRDGDSARWPRDGTEYGGVSQPDSVRQLPNGWTEVIKLSRAFRPDGSQAGVRKLVDLGGVTREVWHEVFDRQGNVLHQHQKPIVRRRPR